MDQNTSVKGPFALDEPVVWRGMDLDLIALGIWYRVDKGPWQIADSMDRVPAGAELHPCYLQRSNYGPEDAR